MDGTLDKIIAPEAQNIFSFTNNESLRKDVSISTWSLEQILAQSDKKWFIKFNKFSNFKTKEILWFWSWSRVLLMNFFAAYFYTWR